MSVAASQTMSMTSSIESAVSTVIDGKSDAVRTVLTALLAEGHVLLEDVPGVGKTQLARAFAATIGGRVHRIQFTPDLLPSDITGVSIYDQRRGQFEFTPGPVFSNIVIADEINRASPKTQSALLECMEEGQVTVDGVTHTLPRPFMVIATQNPIDMDGTYALPEAQRDRFMVRVQLGYPDLAAELHMVQARKVGAPLDGLSAVTNEHEFLREIDAAHAVRAHELVERYAVAIVRATRDVPGVRLGASPRSTLQLLRAAKALAHIHGRSWLSPDDVKELAPQVLPHRLVLEDPNAGIDEARALVTDVLRITPAPVVR